MERKDSEAGVGDAENGVGTERLGGGFKRMGWGSGGLNRRGRGAKWKKKGGPSGKGRRCREWDRDREEGVADQEEGREGVSERGGGNQGEKGTN